MEQSSYDSCIRNNQLMNLCWNELTVKLQRLLTGVNNLNHVLWDRDIFTLTDWRTQTQKAISGYSIAVVLVWNQTNHVQTQSAVLPSQKVLSLSFFLLKKKKSDALIVFIYTYPPKFSILHSVTWLMVCIPIAWVLHHLLLLLWDSLEELSSCPLRAASVPSLAQSVVPAQC